MDYDELFDDPEYDAMNDPTSLDSDESPCYGVCAEYPYCDFGNGDDDGFCIKDRYGCHLEGCPDADPLS